MHGKTPDTYKKSACVSAHVTKNFCFDHDGAQVWRIWYANSKVETSKTDLEMLSFLVPENVRAGSPYPLTILTDNLGAVQGQDRGEAHRTTDNNKKADEWKKIRQAVR